MNVNRSDVVSVVRALRSPQGCPWDKKQTHLSLRKHLEEEVYEVLEVLSEWDSVQNQSEHEQKDWYKKLEEELGDLLLQILLNTAIGEESQKMSFQSVCDSLADKLVRRHPHVFLEGQEVETAEEALKSWKNAKKNEKSHLQKGFLESIPKRQPALRRAQKMIERVSDLGFQWKNWQDSLGKIHEELEEFQHEMLLDPKSSASRSEFGDLLFTVINLGSLSQIDSEHALHEMLDRFQLRFENMALWMKEDGLELEKQSLQTWDLYWTKVKKKIADESKK